MTITLFTLCQSHSQQYKIKPALCTVYCIGPSPLLTSSTYCELERGECVLLETPEDTQSALIVLIVQYILLKVSVFLNLNFCFIFKKCLFYFTIDFNDHNYLLIINKT